MTKRLRLQVLTELEVLVIAEVVGRRILPHVVLRVPFGRIANSLFAAIGKTHRLTFYPATAGESGAEPPHSKTLAREGARIGCP